jgi:hypothetical protein
VTAQVFENANVDSFVRSNTLKLALVGFIVTKISLAVFTLGFGIVSWHSLLAFFNSEKLPEALSQMGLAPEETVGLVLKLTLPPLGYAVLTAVFPFLGAWIYLSTPQNKSTALGLGTAAAFMIMNMIPSLIGGFGAFEAFDGMASAIAIILGLTAETLYTFFVMGIGYNLAKAFKLRP